MNIQDLRQKCNSLAHSRDFLTGVLIILVGTASFGLGRLSGLEAIREPVRIEYPEGIGKEGSFKEVSNTQKQATASVKNAIPGGYVASKSGKKYHLPWCSGASSIKEENKIWFATKEDAEKAGYTPAGNCKGI